MEVRQARYFMAVVDQGTLGRAAEQLHMTQPALSQAILALERELHVQLFKRSKRGMALTSGGEVLLAPARQLVEASQYVDAALQDVRDVTAGRLEIGLMPALAAHPVSSWIGQFIRLHPQVTVKLDVYAGDQPIKDYLAESGAEFVIGHSTSEASEVIQRVPIGTQNLVAVLPQAMSMGAEPVVSIEALADLPLIVSPPGTSMRALVDEAFERVGKSPRIVVETRFMDSFTALIRAGVGYAFLPVYSTEMLATMGAVSRYLQPPVTRKIEVYHRVGAISPAGIAFLRVAMGSGAL